MFLSFSSQLWGYGSKISCFRLFQAWSKMKKYRASLYTFYMIVKMLVKGCRVYFFTFLDSLKVDYEKGNPFQSYILALFSLLKNTKIFMSKIVTFTLVKESEWLTSRGQVISFFDRLALFMRKYLLESSQSFQTL